MGQAAKVIVVGGGMAGASAAEALARRGCSVCLLERFQYGHSRGSSHGDGRIVRYTYAEEVYLEMARHAFVGWQRLEQANGQRLVVPCGSWECGPADSPALDELATQLETAGLSYQRLDPESCKQRFPCLRLQPDEQALFQPDGGVVRADRALAALWQLSTAAGAELRSGVRVRAVESGKGGLVVSTETGESLRADAVVLAVGAWAPELLGSLGLEQSLRVSQELVAYFPPKAGAETIHQHATMPTVIDHGGDFHFYALPPIQVPGVKVGWHRTGPEVDPEQPPVPDQGRLKPLSDYVAKRFPHLQTEPIQISPCLYTNSYDYNFLIDRHPDLPGVVIAGGFSGHGFKFAPVLGEMLAAMALQEPPPVDPTPFHIQRELDEGSVRRGA